MICEIETQVYKHNKVKFMNILTKNLSKYRKATRKTRMVKICVKREDSQSASQRIHPQTLVPAVAGIRPRRKQSLLESRAGFFRKHMGRGHASGKPGSSRHGSF